MSPKKTDSSVPAAIQDAAQRVLEDGKEHRCQIALQYIQTLQNKAGRIVFTCHFPKNKVITVLAVKFHKDLHPMFRKINRNDNNTIY